MGFYDARLKYKRLSDLLPYLLDDRQGIIRRIWEPGRHANMPDLFYFIAQSADTAALQPGGYSATTAGVSCDRDTALAKAIGEAVERYCASLYDRKALLPATYEEMETRAVPPQAFALFSRHQYQSVDFPYQPFTEKTRIRWCRGCDAASGEAIWVPACMVYVPYQVDQNKGEIPIWRPISTGLAAHCSWEEAAVNGILEVMERDCFTITWQARLSRPLIPESSLGRAPLKLIDHYRRLGYAVTLIDIRNETGIPSVMACMWGDQDRDTVPFVVSTASHLQSKHAIMKCIEELALMERYTRRVLASPSSPPQGADFGYVKNFRDHVQLWNTPNFRQNARFLTDSDQLSRPDKWEEIREESPKAALSSLVKRITDSGYQVILADLTTPELRELGLFVIRAIIPGYHPLVQGYSTRALGGRRLWNVPQRLGFAGVDPKAGDNPFPHPFA